MSKRLIRKTSAPTLSDRTFRAVNGECAVLGGVARSHPAANPRHESKRARLAAAVERYRRAAVRYSSAFPCSDRSARAVSDRLNSAWTALHDAVRALHGGARPSPLGRDVEDAAPQAVVVAGTLVVLSEPANGEPTLSLIPLERVVDLG